MKTVILDKYRVYRGNLILVNSKTPVNQEFKVERLVPADENYPYICIEANAAALLSRLLEVSGCKDKIIPVSGHRNRSEQEKIYSDSISKNGYKFTLNYVALPGCSEHQTGLAIDLGKKSNHIDFIRPELPYRGEYGLFRYKAAEYGFIERYKKDKKAFTGIAPEPWHFRYVGYPHSKIMTERDMCLEEYVKFIKNFSETDVFGYQNAAADIEIFFKEAKGDETELTFNDTDCFQISGNNSDGFIITKWRYKA